MSNNEPKYTPGPWRHLMQYDPYAGKYKSYVCYGEPDAVNPDDSTFPPDQCICGCGWSHHKDNMANAQLMAQSPDMFEFICDLVNACDYGTEMLSEGFRQRAEKIICNMYSGLRITR